MDVSRKSFVRATHGRYSSLHITFPPPCFTQSQTHNHEPDSRPQKQCIHDQTSSHRPSLCPKLPRPKKCCFITHIPNRRKFEERGKDMEQPKTLPSVPRKRTQNPNATFHNRSHNADDALHISILIPNHTNPLNLHFHPPGLVTHNKIFGFITPRRNLQIRFRRRTRNERSILPLPVPRRLDL
jgi:hypothetical protein